MSPAAARPRVPPCPGHGRHWYTRPGEVGAVLDACVRCGFPNVRKLAREARDERRKMAAAT